MPAACARRSGHVRARARPLGSSSRCNTAKYCRPGFNCVVKQLRFWLFKVDCEFKDCDLRVLRIGHTCVIAFYNSQSLNYAIEIRPTVT